MTGTAHNLGMYGDRAQYYDAIYHWKQYDKESARLRQLLAAAGIHDGAAVLEAACGTGSHLVHLKQWYAASAFDLSNDMLKIARKKLAGIPRRPGAGLSGELFQADMTNFAVDRQFDALLCLFSSIGYIHPEDRLRAAARCFAHAVRPGGALIVEPWIAPEEFIDGRPWINTYESDQLKLCRMVISHREGEMSILDFHWMAARAGSKDVERFVERHINWLCPRPIMLDVFEDAGFKCRLEPDGLMKGRGLIVGRRR